MTAIVWRKILSVLLYIMATTDASSNLRSTSGSDIKQNEVYWENLRSTIMEDGQIYHDISRRNTKSKKSTKSKKAKRSKSKKSEVVNTADTNNPIFSRTSKIKTEEEVQIELQLQHLFPLLQLVRHQYHHRHQHWFLTLEIVRLMIIIGTWKSC